MAKKHRFVRDTVKKQKALWRCFVRDTVKKQKVLWPRVQIRLRGKFSLHTYDILMNRRHEERVRKYQSLCDALFATTQYEQGFDFGVAGHGARLDEFAAGSQQVGFTFAL
eukprot:1813037-Amphidinium_carterae.1